MAAWRSITPDWFECEPYDRLEAYGQDVGDNVYTDEEWTALPVDDPANERSETGDDRPLTGRAAA